MEYFVGAFATMVAWIVASKYAQDKKVFKKTKSVVYRQSHLFELIKPAIPYMPKPPKQPIVTQSFKDKRDHTKRFLVFENKAYWIANNAVYCADVDNQGIDKDSINTIDTMTMDDVELKKIEFIVNKLTEGDKQ